MPFFLMSFWWWPWSKWWPDWYWLWCVIFGDNFLRPPNYSDSPGCQWKEITGEWSKEPDTVKEAGNDGARLLCTVPNPIKSIRQVVVVRTVNEVAGNKYRIHLNMNKAGSPSPYAEFERGEGDASFVRLFNAGGSKLAESCEEGMQLMGNSRCFYACIAEDIFYAWVDDAASNTFTRFLDLEPTDGNYWVALGNGADQPIQFKDFTYEYHFLDHHPGDSPLCWCRNCECACWEDPGTYAEQRFILPDSLLATVTEDTTHPWSFCEGVEVELKYTYCAVMGQWGIYVGTYTDYNGCEIELHLECAVYPSGCSEWRLTEPSLIEGCAVFNRKPEPGCSCSPLDMVFKLYCVATPHIYFLVEVTLMPP